MLVRLRFRSIAESVQGERVLDRAVPAYTVLPGGVLAVAESHLADAVDALNQAGLDFRQDEVEEFLGGRHLEEWREEGQEHGSH